MKKITLVLCLAVLPFVAGCASFGSIFKDEGPGLTRTATSISMHLWLKKAVVDKSKAAEYRTYILEARGLLAQGQVPSETLDRVASLLNQKIDNDLVRAVIQQGIEIVKTRVVLPSTGILPQSAKVWVFAVLDGSVDGINLYLAEAELPQTSIGAPPTKTVVSFR